MEGCGYGRCGGGGMEGCGRWGDGRMRRGVRGDIKIVHVLWFRNQTLTYGQFVGVWCAHIAHTIPHTSLQTGTGRFPSRREYFPLDGAGGGGGYRPARRTSKTNRSVVYSHSTQTILFVKLRRDEIWNEFTLEVNFQYYAQKMDQHHSQTFQNEPKE